MLDLGRPWGYRQQEEGIQAVSLEEVVQSDRGRSLWLSRGGWDRPGGGGVSLGL